MKTIFITGGATGIGAAAVKKFVDEGWNVGFMDINSNEADCLVKSLPDSGKVLFVEGDTRRREDIHRAVDNTVERFGRIDSVFANAGIHRRNTILNVSDEELDNVIGTNIYGTINTLREVLPHMVKDGGGSVVINASDQVFIGKAQSFAYGLTKGALGQMTKSLSIDLGKHGIRVNSICPGTIRTPLVDRLFDHCASTGEKSVAELWDEENSLYARGRAGTPEEVAELVYFLACDKSSFCTGGNYLVDGGLVAK